VIVNHDALLVAVHAQPTLVVTDAVPAPPVASIDCEFGLIANVHGAACVTVKVCPATVSVPARSAPLLTAMANVTVPLPLPLAP
jgi:hypothetical protein